MTSEKTITGAPLTVKGKKYKSALDEYNKQKPKDNTKDAIKFLNLLSSKKTSTKVVEQVSEYQQRRSVKKVKQEQQKKKQKEAKSCFSEEDFARFEREYFVGPRRR
ncbi:Active regulator of SIRT1 [Amphibalanus amphitrite]|uniref:Active regulator of SIRT1 n=1 Tax=Amphibalanus amphitrite TaxID=1232801 RepID=A0A6A4WZW9_AMPAM|nr:Active regulator of SIRT1 [Amphibalanus amphitrite]